MGWDRLEASGSVEVAGSLYGLRPAAGCSYRCPCSWLLWLAVCQVLRRPRITRGSTRVAHPHCVPQYKTTPADQTRLNAWMKVSPTFEAPCCARNAFALLPPRRDSPCRTGRLHECHDQTRRNKPLSGQGFSEAGPEAGRGLGPAVAKLAAKARA